MCPLLITIKHSIMRTKVLFLLILMSLLSACDTSGGITADSQGNYSLSFSKISLKFDFSKKFYTNYILNDYIEFKNHHCLTNDPNVTPQSPEFFSGEIDNFVDILALADGLPNSQKPSIKLEMYCPDTTIKKSFSRNDVSHYSVSGVPKRNDVAHGFVEIKSYKTTMYGLQVVWRKDGTYPNWPFHDFITDGTINSDVNYIVKVGTNNGRGNVAVREGGIIGNTCMVGGEYHIVVIEEEPLYSQSLEGPIYVGGELSNDVEWDTPAIYKLK